MSYAKLRRYATVSADTVGLSRNAKGVHFQCGTCRFFADGHCHNDNPKLKGQAVEPELCCNLYRHDGMKVLIK